MTKKILLMVSTMIASSMQINAQQFDPNNSLLWQISGNGLKKSSYLVLTTSNLCETSPTLLKKIIKIAEGIEVYYTETGINNPKYNDEAQNYVYLTEKDTSIRKLLSAKLYLKLKSKFSQEQIDEKTTNQLNTMMITNMLTRSISTDCNKPNMTEDILRAYADQYNYKIKELLTLKEAFNLLNTYGNNNYLIEIQNLLNNEEKIKQDFKLKADLYSKENLFEIKKLYAFDKYLGIKYQNVSVFNNRINLLAKRITQAITTECVLMSIDIVTIMNDKLNLFKELEKQGYKITPILY